MLLADLVWVATALLHREQPEREWFAPQEVRERALQEGFGPLPPGFTTHVSQQAVANRPANPGQYRMLFALGHGMRRLFRSDDRADPGRSGKQVPAGDDLPEQYRPLLDWYWAEYDRQPAPSRSVNETAAPFAADAQSPWEFEEAARRALAGFFGVELAPGSVSDVPKRFDFVSPDGSVVGDAKYLTMVGGTALPPAKFSIVGEHVWLLEKTAARERVLVFGNDRRVPVEWLRRFGHLAGAVRFFFLSDEGLLEELSHDPGYDAAWARLSARSFARDWESEEDSVYDALS